MAIALVPQIEEVVSFNRMAARPDSRAVAYEWFSENFEEGTVVGSEVRIRGLPRGIVYEPVTPIYRRSLREWRDRGVSVFLLVDDSRDVPARNVRARLEQERFRARLVPLRRFSGFARGGRGPELVAYRLGDTGP